jgi:DNA-binding transcriptional regulator GbsR (MarR family)
VKGYLLPVAMRGDIDEDYAGELPLWEKRLADAVGTAIEFWGFKQNHGRVWSVLYLDRRAMTAAELQKRLGLSKGAVSMVTRELERWGVVHRVKGGASDSWRFEAETDLWKMMSRVFEEREGQFISRIARDLEQAEEEAKRARVDKDTLERIARLRTLAKLGQQAMDAFLRTARLDASSLAGALVKVGRSAWRKKK